jgi:hypothetical protein
MELNEARRAQLVWSSYTRHFGLNDPRTIKARRAYLLAQVAEHQRAIIELRRSLDELPEAS